jgi:hypothetical protein
LQKLSVRWISENLELVNQLIDTQIILLVWVLELLGVGNVFILKIVTFEARRIPLLSVLALLNERDVLRLGQRV